LSYNDLHPVIRAVIEGRPTSDIPYVSGLSADPNAEALCYVIQAGDDGPVKIGVAINPDRRRTSLQTGSPVPLHIRYLFAGGYDTEAALHKHYDKRYLRGEWFSPDVLHDIQEVASSALAERPAP